MEENLSDEPLDLDEQYWPEYSIFGLKIEIFVQCCCLDFRFV